MKENTLGVTGHRFIEHPTEKILDVTKQSLSLLKEKYQYTNVITGFALGFDQIVAQACIDLNLDFIAAVPFDNHGSTWNQQQVEYYEYLLSKAAKIEIVCPGPYANWKFLKRDEWIVNNSSLLVSYWNGKPKGGTYHTVSYAERNNMKVKNIFSLVG